MRYFLSLIIVVLLSACGPRTRTVSCEDANLTNKSAAQINNIEAYCAEEMIRINAEKAAMEQKSGENRIRNESAAAGMSPDEYLGTRLGLFTIISEIIPILIALFLIITTWVSVMFFTRLLLWEQDEATRKKWGPFSFWEIKYTQRKNDFGDISPTQWFFWLSLISTLITLFIYAGIK